MLKRLLYSLVSIVRKLYKFVSYLVILGFAFLGLLIVALVLYFYSSRADLLAQKENKMEDKEAYLYLKLGQVSEKSVEFPFYKALAKNLGVNFPNQMSITSLKEVLDAAANDKRIKGIFFNTDEYASETFAINTELHEAIVRFQNISHKPIYTYSVHYGLADIVAFRTVDKMFIGKAGGFDANDVQVSSYFLGDFYKNFGVKDYSYQSGKFGLTNLMSQSGFTKENQLNIDALVWKPLNSIFEEFNQAKKLNLKLKDFGYEKLVNNAYQFISESQYAVKTGIVDEAVSPFGWEDFVKKTAGVDKNTKRAKLVSYNKYVEDMKASGYYDNSDDKDYYLTYYYSGFLTPGGLDTNSIANELYSLIPKKEDNEKESEVKSNDNEKSKLRGVVLRLESGGGSIADAIPLYNALKALRESGIPVVVSVPDTLTGAAYVGSLGANGIVASRFASIGHINSSTHFLDVTDTLRAFYNINPSYIKGSKLVTGPAVIPFPLNIIIKGVNYSGTTSEFVAYKHLVTDNKYEQQVEMLANARRFTIPQARNLSQGIVYTAADAKAMGLIDRVGGVEEAYSLLDKINQSMDKDFDKEVIMHYEANPDSAPYSSLLATLNNELSSYFDYNVRSNLGLSKIAYQGLKLYVDSAKTGEVLDICIPCANAKLNYNTVSPHRDSKMNLTNPTYSFFSYFFSRE